jgi:hypothetical protein
MGTYGEDRKLTIVQRVIDEIFWLAVVRASIEQLLPRLFIPVCLFGYFGINISIFYYESISVIEYSVYARVGSTVYEDIGRLMVHVYFIILLAIQSISGCNYARIGTNSLMYRISIYMTIAFTYIVYPLMTWVMSRNIRRAILGIDNSTGTYILLGIEILLFILGVIYIYMTFCFRINIPSRYLLSTIHRSTEIMASLSLTFVIILHFVMSTMQYHIGRVAISCIEDAILLSSLIVVLRRQPYWDRQMNLIYSTGYACVIGWKIVADFNTSNGDLVVGAIYLLVMSAVHRLNRNIVLQACKIDVFNPRMDPHYRFIGFIYLEQAVLADVDDSLEAEERDLVTYYRGLIAPPSCDFIPQNKPKVGDVHTLIMSELRALSKLDPHVCRLILLIQLSKPFPHLKDLRNLFQGMEGQHRANFMAAFDQYHYRKLYENKLDALYKGKIKDGESSECCVSDIYEGVFYTRLSTVIRTDNTYLDVCRVFRDLDKYKRVGRYSTDLLQTRLHVLDSLLGEAPISSSILFRYNEMTHTDHLEIMQIYDDMNMDIRPHASYIYPIFIYYFSLIRNSIRTAEQLFKTYKSRLMQAANSYMYMDRYSSFDQRLSDTNAVAMRISLDRDHLGEILLHTVNICTYLGHPGDLQPLGKNINDLFPGKLGKKHVSIMTSYSKFGNLHAHERDIFINGFDGFLRRVRICVRIVPDLSSNLSGVALLTFTVNSSSSLVLLERDMQIINAERRFWDFIDRVEVSEELLNLNQLSRTLCGAMAVVSKFNPLEDLTRKARHASDDVKGLIADIHLGVAELVAANQGGGVRYKVDRESEYFDQLSSVRLIASFRLTWVMGTEIVKLCLRIDGVETLHRPDREGDGEGRSEDEGESGERGHSTFFEEEVVDASVSSNGRIDSSAVVGGLRESRVMLKRQEEAFSCKSLEEILVPRVQNLRSFFQNANSSTIDDLESACSVRLFDLINEMRLFEVQTAAQYNSMKEIVMFQKQAGGASSKYNTSVDPNPKLPFHQGTAELLDSQTNKEGKTPALSTVPIASSAATNHNLQLHSRPGFRIDIFSSRKKQLRRTLREDPSGMPFILVRRETAQIGNPFRTCLEKSGYALKRSEGQQQINLLPTFLDVAATSGVKVYGLQPRRSFVAPYKPGHQSHSPTHQLVLAKAPMELRLLRIKSAKPLETKRMDNRKKEKMLAAKDAHHALGTTHGVAKILHKVMVG